MILCGGRARRLGGVDKPLLRIAGKTLLERAVRALRPQVQAVVVSAPADPGAYDGLDIAVVPDEAPDQGPLAGLASCLPHVATPWLLTWPGDAPCPPTDLIARLRPVCRGAGAATVCADGRRQNATVLMTRERAAAFVRRFRQGERKLADVLDREAVPAVAMPAAGFIDIDTPEDLARAGDLAAAAGPDGARENR